tara:strand:- start:2077 stop:2436 length:360 start_codon:yes stop_codon:yes gene_type:complete
MTVKLLLLKSGEDIVADIQEMIVDEKVVGYYLKYPCRVKLVADMTQVDGNSKVPSKIQLQPWMPLSSDKVIPVVSDWVVTIAEPVNQLKKMYQDGVDQYEARESESANPDESTDSVSTD